MGNFHLCVASSLPTYCGSLVAAHFEQFPGQFVGLSDPVRGFLFLLAGQFYSAWRCRSTCGSPRHCLWVSFSTSGSVLQFAS